MHEIKLDPTIVAIALLNRQEQISSDDANAMGCSEAIRDISKNLQEQARKVLLNAGHTADTWKTVLEKLTFDDLKLLKATVETAMPNPFEWKPPEGDFCSCCGTGTKVFDRKVPPQGWKWRPGDEDDIGQWLFYGQSVICNSCHEDGDMPDEAEDHGPDPQFDTPEYESYCLKMQLLGSITRDW